jgi:hypothetical protein
MINAQTNKERPDICPPPKISSPTLIRQARSSRTSTLQPINALPPAYSNLFTSIYFYSSLFAPRGRYRIAMTQSPSAVVAVRKGPKSKILIHRDFSFQSHSKVFKAAQSYSKVFRCIIFYFYAPIPKTPSRYTNVTPPTEWSFCIDGRKVLRQPLPTYANLCQLSPSPPFFSTVAFIPFILSILSKT